jgi:hypothetical protein
VQPPLPALLEFEMLHGVGDEDLAAVEPRLLDGTVEHAPGRADKRLAFEVFLVARLLADQHQPGARGALAGHHLGGIFIERTARALCLRLRQRRERSVGNRFGHASIRLSPNQ